MRRDNVPSDPPTQIEKSSEKLNEINPFKEFGSGLMDAISVHRVLRLYLDSERARSLTAKCFLLNGVIFLGSMVMFESVVRPSIIRIAGFVLEEPQNVVGLADIVMSWIFRFFWIVPAYAISFVLNCVFYEEIADVAFKYYSPGRKSKRMSFTRLIAEELYRICIMIFIFFEVSLVACVPIAGHFLAISMLTWVYAYYCFEYKWILQGRSLSRRLKEIESNWIYYAGFGTPCTLATYFFPSLVAGGLFGVLFPIFLLTAMSVSPSSTTTTRRRLPIFASSKHAVESLVRLGFRCKNGGGTGTSGKKKKSDDGAVKTTRR